jgi:uncharacterized protein YecE (DUF72 family)
VTQIRIGCSGWSYQSWRQRFYPEGMGQGRWLSHYAAEFDTVEANTTFYRLASASGVERWVEQTPPEFCFAVKASRYMTHIKRLAGIETAIERFYEPLEALVRARKLGPVVWQLPPNFQRDDARLEATLALLPAGRHCFEFRHPSWFADPVIERLRERGVALVIGDHPERPFQRLDLTADFTLVRFHWGARGRRGNYSRAEIADWAQRLRDLARDVDVFAYFNNDWEAFAIRNARLLKRLLPDERV